MSDNSWLTNAHISSLSSKLTPEEITSLRAKAIDAKSRAYCPYSNFRVGACLLSTSDTYITGVNVENACYPVGICAERTALAKAASDGVTNFKAVAVASDISPPASPCGMCRQGIREFCGLDTPILMFDADGEMTVMLLEELLPMSFGPESLAANKAGRQ